MANYRSLLITDVKLMSMGIVISIGVIISMSMDIRMSLLAAVLVKA